MHMYSLNSYIDIDSAVICIQAGHRPQPIKARCMNSRGRCYIYAIEAYILNNAENAMC